MFNRSPIAIATTQTGQTGQEKQPCRFWPTKFKVRRAKGEERKSPEFLRSSPFALRTLVFSKSRDTCRKPLLILAAQKDYKRKATIHRSRDGPMRICLYTDTALPKMGGQEIVVDALARQFVALGHQPIVLAPRPRKLSIRGESYPYEVVRHPRFFSTQYFVSWYRYFLATQYRSRPFDVLHCHGIYPPSYLASLLGERLPVPVIVTSHGGDVYEHNIRLQKPVVVQRCAEGLRSADALVAISRFTREGFARLCPESAARIVDIPNGVDVAACAQRVPAPSETHFRLPAQSYAVFLGRLKYRKGADVLLQALARTPETDKVQLVIIGDGEERAALEILSDQLGLTDRVRFLGAVTGSAKAYLLQNARFGVVPSRHWESFGLVVLEGYASGLPMIAADLPGLTDLIQPEKTGLIVPPEDPESLAVALERLFFDDALVQRMSTRAGQVVQQYDWSTIARRHLALYEHLLLVPRSMAA
jgi:glycosyltransferase involved in cell wall biosynthesis